LNILASEIEIPIEFGQTIDKSFINYSRYSYFLKFSYLMPRKTKSKFIWKNRIVKSFLVILDVFKHFQVKI